MDWTRAVLVERVRTGTFQEIFSIIRLTGLGCLLDKEGEGKVSIKDDSWVSCLYKWTDKRIMR